MCVGDLKAPICIQHIDNPSKAVVFKINPYELIADIGWILDIILWQDFEKASEDLGFEINISEFTELSIETIKFMREQVRKFPILEESERVFLGWVRRRLSLDISN